MRRIIIFALASFLCIGQVQAEGMADEAYTSVLLELNRIRPDQNPNITLGKNQLNARILDKNQRTLGKVIDIVVAADGKFETILTKVDISGFREDVAFDVASYVIDPTPDTFTISLDKSQLKDNIAQLMAATSTASGETGPFTVKALQNGDIYKADGSQIAKVKDVLIDNRNLKIISMLVTISSGTKRGSTVAIPYEAAQAKLNGSKASLTVTDAQAEIMTSMATRRY